MSFQQLLPMSQNVGLTVIAYPRCLVSKRPAKTHALLPIHARGAKSVLLLTLLLEDLLLLVLVPITILLMIEDIVSQVGLLQLFPLPKEITSQKHKLSILVLAQNECEVDEDCQDTHRCNDGSCQNACHYTNCGQNAYCDSYRHEGHCKCFLGFVGNPLNACKKRKYLLEHLE